MEFHDEYAERGAYHRELSKDWSYYPIYQRKTELIERLMRGFPAGARVLDAGCGEGVFVDQLRACGFDAVGVDQSCVAPHVVRGNVLALPFDDADFDVVLCLDVIEHLDYRDQPTLLREIRRVLRPGGRLLISIPNLAHLYSRVRFLLRGKLKRTASIEKHPGDRPIAEFLELLGHAGFRIEQRYGIFPTLPLLYRIMQRHPRRSLWLHAILNRILALPNICFLNLMVCRPQAAEAGV